MPEWQKSGETLVFDPPNHVVTHVPTELNAAWKAQLSTGGTGWIVYKPSTSRKPADVIIRMCENPREDFLDRSWLLCDMVGSVVQISSLWLANHRRHGNDDAFTAVMNRTNPDGSPYISLGPVIQFDGKHDLDILMCDDQDPFFENVDLELNDLQVGDFVCFWNGRIYNLLSSGAWRNEFSYVMGIDVDGRTGNVRVLTNGPQIFLAGHGVHTKLYNAMAAELAAILNVETFLARFVVEEKVRATPGLREVSLGPQSKAVLWSPYESFDAPGAWWVEIPPEIWNKDWSYPTIDDVLKAVPRTIAKEAGGAGYVNPPRGDAVYFPLYEPAVAGPDGDSWRAYLRQRKANASFRPPSELKHLTIDGRIALGLFYRGPKTKFPVVRPRVRG
jgi:hypothetical protein